MVKKKLLRVMALLLTSCVPGGGSWLGPRATDDSGLVALIDEHRPCTIPRLRAEEMSKERFSEEFEGRAPFVLANYGVINLPPTLRAEPTYPRGGWAGRNPACRQTLLP